ncbi:hypothetical protein BD410DRAFT_888232 [Rickenella mellea]|uniref:Uncharacterized protein n=1 Tax=Rickenella mellea TaxID=50990 RepID=A0A4Y7PNZ0_9AGAM|nr:hypothetical protein BD410DRAFT_888232 [Rickenella mellea]
MKRTDVFERPNWNEAFLGPDRSFLDIIDDISKTWQIPKLLSQEFIFGADMSCLPYGRYGATYLTETSSTTYGMGFSDSQCPDDWNYINCEEMLFQNLNNTCYEEIGVWATPLPPQHVSSPSSVRPTASDLVGDHGTRPTLWVSGMRTDVTLTRSTSVANHAPRPSSSPLVYYTFSRRSDFGLGNVPGILVASSVMEAFWTTRNQTFGDINTVNTVRDLAAVVSAPHPGTALAKSETEADAAQML